MPWPDFFSPFFGDNRPTPAVDSSRAPPPRKLKTPPTRTVMVIGDSLVDWLAYGLDEFYADHPEIGFERKIAATSGPRKRILIFNLRPAAATMSHDQDDYLRRTTL
jgi:hypothetical protein